jgi:ribosome-associated protein
MAAAKEDRNSGRTERSEQHDAHYEDDQRSGLPAGRVRHPGWDDHCSVSRRPDRSPGVAPAPPAASAPRLSDSLRIGRHVEVPLSEVQLRATRSSGPGGQHANVTASRVEAAFDVDASRALSDEHKRRIRARLGPVVRATAQDTRSQARNRELALERLSSRLASALTVRRPRRATKPSREARRRRIESKRHRGELKRARRRPDADA